MDSFSTNICYSLLTSINFFITKTTVHLCEPAPALHAFENVSLKILINGFIFKILKSRLHVVSNEDWHLKRFNVAFINETFHFPIHLVTALTDSGTEHVENISVTSTDRNTEISL